MLLFPELDAPFNRMTRPGSTSGTGHNLAVGSDGRLEDGDLAPRPVNDRFRQVDSVAVSGDRWPRSPVAILPSRHRRENFEGARGGHRTRELYPASDKTAMEGFRDVVARAGPVRCS